MKSKLLLVAAIAALGLFSVWYALKGTGGEIDTTDPDTANVETDSGVPSGPDEAPDMDLAELDAPAAEDGPTRNSVEADEEVAESEAPLAVWDESETLWVDATMIAPEGTPIDEQAYVLALSGPMTAAKGFGDDGPFAAIRSGRDARRVKGVIAAATVAPDGRARLALPPETTEAWIVVGGSYVYSNTPKHLAQVDVANEVTLRPALGAHITGKVLAPDGRTETEGVKLNIDWSLNARLQLGTADAGPLDRTTESGADGQFHFYAVPASRPVAVKTRSDLYARSFSEDIQPVAGERHNLTITLATGGTVKGRVVNDKGDAVAGSSVIALGQEFFGNPSEDLRKGDCGDDGTFELTGVTAGRVWIRVKHDDYQETMGSSLELSDGQVLKVPDIVLDRGLSLTGSVTFPDGRPASGAKIEVEPDLGENAAGSPMDPRAFAGAENDATTDESGAFEIFGLGKGPWAVTVELDAKDQEKPEENGRWSAFQALVHAPSEKLVLTLEPPVNFIGSVVDGSGEPVTAFTVKGERTGSQWYMPPSETKTEGFEPEDGKFIFTNLRSGDWTFTVEAEGMARSEKLTVTLPTTEESPFVLYAPIRLTGKILDPGGLPVSGAEIAKELEGQEVFQAMQGRGDWVTAKSDGEGLFALEGLAPGAGSIVAKKDGWAPSEGFAYELAEGESEGDIVLVMRHGGTISGEIFGPDGEPAAGCMIIIQMPTMEERRFANADSDGRFEENGLTPGSWQVQAFPGIQSLQPEDGETLDQATLIKALKMTSVDLKDEATEHVVLGSPPAAPVRVFGQVALAGDSVPELIISFMKGAGGGLEGLKIGSTDKEGRYELILDEPGDYLMTVQSAGAAGMQNSVEFRRNIPEGDEYELNVEMPMGRITGRVLGPGGTPQADARVTLSMQSGQVFGTVMGGQYNETRTDSEGQYEIIFVRPGDYAVAAGGSYLGGLLGGNGSLGRKVQSVTVGEGKWETVNFQLEAPGELHGIVRGTDGKPVAEASIFLRDENGHLLELFSFQATNASGAFEYDGLAPGEYTITARAEGMSSSSGTTVRIRSGEVTETTVAVASGTILLVSLTDKTGADIRSRVSVLDEQGNEVNGMLSLQELMGRISSGFDGKEQRVGPLPPGLYQVRAFAEDGRSATRRARLTGKAEKKLKLRLK